MLQTIQRLREERQKITTKFEKSRKEYRIKVKRLDTAIKRFSQGCSALNGKLPEQLEKTPKPVKRGMAIEIKNILADGLPRHVNEIVEELKERGFNAKYSSVSATLQIQAKIGDGDGVFKIAPATYASIPIDEVVEKQRYEQSVDFGDDLILNDFDEAF